MTDQNDSRRSGGRRSILPLVIGLPLIAIVAAVAIFLTSSGPDDSENVQTPSRESGAGDQASSGANPSEGEIGTPTLGEADAPVVMMEFSDYQ